MTAVPQKRIAVARKHYFLLQMFVIRQITIQLNTFKHIKKLLMLFALMIGLMSCGSGDNTATAKSLEKDRVEVIYFHGKQPY